MCDFPGSEAWTLLPSCVSPGKSGDLSGLHFFLLQWEDDKSAQELELMPRKYLAQSMAAAIIIITLWLFLDSVQTVIMPNYAF